MKSSSWTLVLFCLQCWKFTYGFSLLAQSYTRFPKQRVDLSLSDQLEEESSEDSVSNDSNRNNSEPPVPRTPPRQPKLDPLMVSLTRNNDPTYDPNAPKVAVPLLGELALDRSFFYRGIGQFGDAFVEAIQQSTAEILTPPSSAPIDPSQCRGLCSQQDANLEEMRVFMNKFARK